MYTSLVAVNACVREESDIDSEFEDAFGKETTQVGITSLTKHANFAYTLTFSSSFVKSFS